MAKFSAKVYVTFDKVLSKDEHIVIDGVFGDSLQELNDNAKELIGDYKAYNNINATAKYHLFDTPGTVASTLDAIGNV